MMEWFDHAAVEMEIAHLRNSLARILRQNFQSSAACVNSIGTVLFHVGSRNLPQSKASREGKDMPRSSSFAIISRQVRLTTVKPAKALQEAAKQLAMN
jgi:hypothetical protein